MIIVGLLTDFGLQDSYAGVIKGVIARINPKAHCVDITHQIPSCCLRTAAFVLLNSYSYFPAGTIFLAVVDPGVGSKRVAIAVKTKNYYFVGPDNGILAPVAYKDGIERIVSLDNKRYFLREISNTFHGRDIFAPVAAYLSKNIRITNLGASLEKMQPLDIPRPIKSSNTLRGEVIYIDKFGNLVTNIKSESLFEFVKGKKFIASLGDMKIKRIYSFYEEARGNEPFFIEGSFSFLEISLKKASAGDYFKTKLADKIIVRKQR
ncbi:MAG: SAM-dependent chlorinase/fluorinase [Candidatus Omnitrophota bacterium]